MRTSLLPPLAFVVFGVIQHVLDEQLPVVLPDSQGAGALPLRGEGTLRMGHLVWQWKQLPCVGAASAAKLRCGGIAKAFADKSAPTGRRCTDPRSCMVVQL
jgi:hypothetical protein